MVFMVMRLYVFVCFFSFCFIIIFLIYEKMIFFHLLKNFFYFLILIYNLIYELWISIFDNDFRLIKTSNPQKMKRS